MWAAERSRLVRQIAIWEDRLAVAPVARGGLAPGGLAPGGFARGLVGALTRSLPCPPGCCASAAIGSTRRRHSVGGAKDEGIQLKESAEYSD